MKQFFKQNGFLLLAILVVAIIGGVIVNLFLTKQVQVDPVTGEALPGGSAFKGKISFKGTAPVIK
jgi:hypothetical protein